MNTQYIFITSQRISPTLPYTFCQFLNVLLKLKHTLWHKELVKLGVSERMQERLTHCIAFH